VANIIETGAEVVATACPSCVLHLTDLLRREGVLISVVHVCDLIEKSVSGLPAHQTLTGSRL
jgi:glycolate oxidase iron-sulfur subunit